MSELIDNDQITVERAIKDIRDNLIKISEIRLNPATEDLLVPEFGNLMSCYTVLSLLLTHISARDTAVRWRIIVGGRS